MSARLGSGRYGVCFLAEDPSGRRVVLKRFRRRMLRRNAGSNHYEAVILSGLSHPAIPQLLGVVNDRTGYWFVLECQPGRTLRSWLFDGHRTFTRHEIADIGVRLLEIVTYLHDRSVIHGDISIANVLYDDADATDGGVAGADAEDGDDGDVARGRVSLIDFGLARYIGSRIGEVPIGDIGLDHARLADVLLYLMYSCENLSRGCDRAAWYDDLRLTAAQRECMKRLMGFGTPYVDTASASSDFRRAFADWS
ncbi:protein kinase domain-containing protein [Bifidobacterium margollesii]|uniref:protein kinase domain-containing protein n=1 Tax=Bifidobacterium margollesii TaxID=2020964 RepID=UPI0013FDE86A|nr:protein kinase family protein [Bifidobacterium margollesii]